MESCYKLLLVTVGVVWQQASLLSTATSLVIIYGNSSGDGNTQQAVTMINQPPTPGGATASPDNLNLSTAGTRQQPVYTQTPLFLYSLLASLICYKFLQITLRHNKFNKLHYVITSFSRDQNACIFVVLLYVICESFVCSWWRVSSGNLYLVSV